MPAQQPIVHQNQPQTKPQQLASTVADWCRAGITMTSWLVLSALAAATAYVCLRGIHWSMGQILRAVGIGPS